ncbi:Hypothetical protein NGAL_HAMBI1145_59730 [Neorhizobium galegae bv. officinalis]|uniref:Uncharacterized protein n=1 Tax=Neorhizobium galegae bv. officinalis TaxID=323656 RepID=A0A0T7G2W5_NEOGA|nr:hypothetical protein [Neorhizobium galegae]CDZ41599.1 Hypothetical protein NGAL_HAMBI1145_59730 [Neorhizobium galegae bv. officinalis]
MSRIDIFIDAGQGDSQNTIGGFRTGAYVVKAVSENREKIFWGIGRVRNPQAFFADAVVAALHDVFEEALDGGDRKFDIRIICAKTGWWEQLDHLRGREKKSQAAALEIDQRDSWMRLGAYEAMLGLQKPESPCGPKDYAELEALADLKRAYAKKASLTVPQPCQGIFDQGIVDEG